MPDGRSSIDDIIDLYVKDVDISLIKENLKLTPEERITKLTGFVNFILELRSANVRRLKEGRPE